MEGLANLRPRFEAALEVINSNMADIAQLRQKAGLHTASVRDELPANIVLPRQIGSTLCQKQKSAD